MSSWREGEGDDLVALIVTTPHLTHMSDPTTLILQVTISSPDAPKGREVQLDVDSSAHVTPDLTPHIPHMYR